MDEIIKGKKQRNISLCSREKALKQRFWCSEITVRVRSKSGRAECTTRGCSFFIRTENYAALSKASRIRFWLSILK